MIGEIEFMTHEGTCRYCGMIQPILAADQIDADIKISEGCECDGYQREKQHDMMISNIDTTFGSGCVKYKLQQVPDEQLEAITEAAEKVFKEVVNNVTIGLFGSIAKISRNAKGNIKIERTFTSKVQTEA